MAVFKQVPLESLKDRVADQLEDLILSGQLEIGQKLPSERDLAAKLGVGRPLVHEALVELESCDLVDMKPRSGTVVNDYRRHGSLAILDALLRYNKGELEPRLFEGVIELRLLFEQESIRHAAKKRTAADLAFIAQILEDEKTADLQDYEAVTQLDFSFHLAVTIASQNMVYPLILNSFRKIYTSYSGKYFEAGNSAEKVFIVHRKIYDALRRRDADEAEALMKGLVKYGSSVLRKLKKKKK